MKAPSRRMSGVLAAGAVALAVVSGTAGAALAPPYTRLCGNDLSKRACCR